ncbi:DNA polymerase Ligase (LigD) [uncultured archaeon]|nr:DNA polymerase Ligase (LigD) [uncultured archaeon]
MAPKKTALAYSVQEHHASHLHYDLRLERDGVLKSWAVPKGVPEDDSRRLAVEVEDHPLDYAFFEGKIPEGSYGAGTVKLWDRGTYTVINWGDDKIEIKIDGRRIRGAYALVRMNGKNWLIFKSKKQQK